MIVDAGRSDGACPPRDRHLVQTAHDIAGSPQTGHRGALTVINQDRAAGRLDLRSEHHRQIGIGPGTAPAFADTETSTLTRVRTR